MKSEIIEIDIDSIKPNKNQSRKTFDEEKLQHLAESIKKVGLINPIQVKKEGSHYEIISGERRWRAHKLAGITKIKAIVKEISDTQSSVENLIENLHRENLSLDEQGNHLNMIKKNEKIETIAELSKRVGLSRSMVTSALAYSDLDDDVKKSAEGIADHNVVEVIQAIPDKKTRMRILKKSAENDWGRKQIREMSNIARNSPKEVTAAVFNDDISVEQAGSISKLKTEESRIKAIQEHKNLKMVDKGIEKNIERQISNAEKLKMNRQLIQARNVIATFRATSVECSKLVQRTIKSLILANSFINVLDEAQADKLKHYIELWETTMGNAIKLAEQV